MGVGIASAQRIGLYSRSIDASIDMAAVARSSQPRAPAALLQPGVHFTVQAPRNALSNTPAHHRLHQISDAALTAALTPTPPDLMGTALTDWRRKNGQYLPQISPWAKHFEPDMRDGAMAQMFDARHDKDMALVLIDGLSNLGTGGTSKLPVAIASTAFGTPQARGWFAKQLLPLSKRWARAGAPDTGFARWLSRTPEGQRFQTALESFAGEVDRAIQQIDVNRIIANPASLDSTIQALSAARFKLVQLSSDIASAPNAFQYTQARTTALDATTARFSHALERALLERGYMPTSTNRQQQARGAVSFVHGTFKLSDADLALHQKWLAVLDDTSGVALATLPPSERAAFVVWQSDSGRFFHARHASADPQTVARVQSAIDLETFKIGLTAENYPARMHELQQRVKTNKLAYDKAATVYKRAREPITIIEQALAETGQRRDALAHTRDSLQQLGHSAPNSLFAELDALGTKLAQLNQALEQRLNGRQFVAAQQAHTEAKVAFEQLKLIESQAHAMGQSLAPLP